MKLKKLALISSLGLLTVAAVSCGSSKTSYNTTTPYGSLDLNKVVATAEDSANDKTFELKNDVYYDQLRYNGYNIVLDKIKETIYTNELKAIKALFESQTLAQYNNSLDSDIANLIIPTKNGEKLFELNDDSLIGKYDNGTIYLDGVDEITLSNNYDYIRRNLIETINQSLSSTIYGSNSYESIEEMSKSDLNKKLLSFKAAQEALGYTFNIDGEGSNVKYGYADNERDVVSFNEIHSELFEHLLDDLFLSYAANLSAQNALYQIADEEYITKYDEDEEKKNESNYIFKDENYESTYDSTYYTYATHKYVYISFNSRLEAQNAVEACGIDFNSIKAIEDEEERLEQAKQAYLALYNSYYNYKTATDLDDDRFTYSINSNKDDLSDLPSGVKSLLTGDLQEGEFLVEPRNIENKYVMALHIESQYDYEDQDGKQIEYDNLEEAEKENLIHKIKYDLISKNAASYVNTNFESVIYKATDSSTKDDDLYIYDPIIEYQFYNTYKNQYDRISKKQYNASKGNLIFKFGDTEYTVEDFYKDSAEENGSNIMITYFRYEYCYSLFDRLMDDDKHEDYEDELDDAIDDFKSGDTSYPKYLGTNNFLLLKYGYASKDNALKFGLEGPHLFDKYYTEYCYKEWATYNEETGTYELKEGLDTATSGILYNLLNKGNEQYSKLLNLNLSHILINIDDDGDGSPDDPEKFLKDMSAEQIKDFYQSIQDLAQAIYKEAKFLYEAYDDNTYVEILKYIKKNYEKGTSLHSSASTFWSDFSKYNFLLTVEDLSDIDQSSVNNFVKPFKEYVKNLYYGIVDNSDVKKSYSDGTFVIITDTKTGLLDSESDIYITYDEITKETNTSLCDTEYGYHLLILNSYEEIDTLTYAKSSTNVGDVTVLIYEDTDDDSNNITVVVSQYNETLNAKEANFNQFFIYYCQTMLNESSSLNTKIYDVMEDLFSDVLTQYKTRDFQNYVLYNYINIKVNDDENLQKKIDGEIAKIGMSFYEYDEESEYKEWITDIDYTDWLRPYQKKNS